MWVLAGRYTYLFGLEVAGYLGAILGAETVGQLAGLCVATLSGVCGRIRCWRWCCNKNKKSKLIT